MKLRVLIATAVLTGLAASTHAIDFYVAKDGDDTNSGLTRAEAKATIEAGYYCLTNDAAATVGDRLVLCDGEWTNTFTVVLSNGWEFVSENGPEKTTLVPGAIRALFTISSADSAIRNITVDFARISNFSLEHGSLTSQNSRGTISGCVVKNFKTSGAGGNRCLSKISTSGVEMTISNCMFNTCNVNYRHALFWAKSGKMHFWNCAFIDCHAVNLSGTKYFNYGLIHIEAASTIRNSLFLRCSSYGTFGSSSPNNHSSIVHINTGSKAIVESCTFAACTVGGGSEGGALSSHTRTGTAGTARNCLAYGCSNNSGPANLLGGLTYSHCASDTELAGEGNVIVNSTNTTFQNTLGGRYIPMTGPAVDGGESLDWMAGAEDLRGFDRTIGSAPDIGCYEFSQPATYYVAPDGNDANPGTSRALAKATLAAGYSLLSGWDETLIVCGTNELDVSALTIVISNGWTLAGENGMDSTTIRLKSIARNSHKLLKLTDDFSEIRDITFDLNNVSFSSTPLSDPKGKFSRCAFLNSNVTSTDGSSAFCRLSGTSAPIFTDCIFRNAKIQYNGGSAFWLSETTGWPKLIGCSFIDCVAGTASTSARSTIFAYRGNCEIRNCLFLRNIVKGATDNSYGDGKRNHIVASSSSRTFKVENCSFIDCEIQRNPDAGALGVGAGGNIQAVNCFAYGTTNTTGTANLMTNIFASGSITFSHCASDKLVPGESNVILTDANFSYRNKRNGDFTVKRGPTIDAGTNLTWMADALDLMGRPRITGNIVDIGCFELETSRATRLMAR
jgi:hypothetical protein